ncbi:uncharacterized protein LOC131958451 [Physella acuta]|uniref:uncharacterized protein LOC131958451 n=1 Tax=Physella acuta TaxID=109671 RepID=UPI0027DC9F06|nr:uncharacterized protein LOC131958451 [Physella acuta]
MKVVFVFVAITIVSGQDPTTVCLPPQIQAGFFNFIDNSYGSYAADFSRGQAAKFGANDDPRTVFDLRTFLAYNITKDDNCTVYRMDSSEAIFQCLPPTAYVISPNGTHLGGGADVLDVQTWELDLGQDTTMRLAFTLGSPRLPLVRHIKRTGSGSPLAVIIFYNPVTQVDPAVFTLPRSCFHSKLRPRL